MAAPKIEWGPGFVNTWLFPGKVDNPLPRPELNGITTESEAGNRDWTEWRADDHEIEIIVRMVPRLNNGSVTGYSTPNVGVYHALAWLAKGGNQARYYPDSALGSFHLVEAIGLVPKDVVSREPGGARYRIGPIRLRDVNGTVFSEY